MLLRFRTFLVTIHVAGWLIFMALPLLFMNAGPEDDNLHLLTLFYYWLFCATYIILFYFNGYFLIPLLFFKKRYVAYSLVILSLLIGVYALKPFDRLARSNDRWLGVSFPPRFAPMRDVLSGQRIDPPPPNHDAPERPSFRRNPQFFQPGRPAQFPAQFGPRRHFDIISFFLFLMIIALSSAIQIMQQWQLSEERAKQAESDKTSAELSFLKAQINPHFLFNTLNNIYTLTVIQDEHAPDSILKLSNIMRYVTDDTRGDFVPLIYEIGCINDYIELQKLRLGGKTRIDFKVTGDVESKDIAPLILMTFVENIFRYGTSNHEQSTVSINILVHENGISFYSQNRIFHSKNVDERAGVGMDNVKQRLAYLYPDKHVLSINTENQLYTVNLIIRA